MKKNELFEQQPKIPLLGVPHTIADYFCNIPPRKIGGKDIYYVRTDGTLACNRIFYAENKNGEMSFFELIDMKGDLKINEQNKYKRFIITPVFPYIKCIKGVENKDAV